MISLAPLPRQAGSQADQHKEAISFPSFKDNIPGKHRGEQREMAYWPIRDLAYLRFFPWHLLPAGTFLCRQTSRDLHIGYCDDANSSNKRRCIVKRDLVLTSALLLVAVVAAACAGQGGSVSDYASVVDNLRGAGVTIAS